MRLRAHAGRIPRSWSDPAGRSGRSQPNRRVVEGAAAVGGNPIGANQLVDPESAGEIAVGPNALHDHDTALNTAKRADLQGEPATPVADLDLALGDEPERFHVFRA